MQSRGQSIKRQPFVLTAVPGSMALQQHGTTIARRASASEAAMMVGEEEVMMTTKTVAIRVGNLKPAVEHPKLQLLSEHLRTRVTLQAVAMVVTEAMMGMAETAAMMIESAKALQGHPAPYVMQEGRQITLSGYAL